MEKKLMIVATLFCSAVLSYGQVATKVMNPEGKMTSQFENQNEKESLPKLTDGSVNTKYYQPKKSALWVQYESTTPVVANQYTIASANDMPDRDPKNWTLKGSNDGVKWVDLDSQKDQTFETRKTEKSYKFPNKIGYKFYRLDITSNNGATSGTQFSEWSLSFVK